MDTSFVVLDTKRTRPVEELFWCADAVIHLATTYG